MPWEESKPVYELKNGNEIGLPSHKSGGQNTRFQGDQEVINMDYSMYFAHYLLLPNNFLTKEHVTY